MFNNQIAVPPIKCLSRRLNRWALFLLCGRASIRDRGNAIADVLPRGPANQHIHFAVVVVLPFGLFFCFLFQVVCPVFVALDWVTILRRGSRGPLTVTREVLVGVSSAASHAWAKCAEVG